MFNLTLIVCLGLVLIILYLVLVKPLFLVKTSPYFSTSDTNEASFDESISILEAITELDTDYKMGKLSQEDYESISLEYKRQYLEQKGSTGDKK